MSLLGHQLPRRSLTGGAAITPITDINATRRRGRNGPIASLRNRVTSHRGKSASFSATRPPCSRTQTCQSGRAIIRDDPVRVTPAGGSDGNQYRKTEIHSCFGRHSRVAAHPDPELENTIGQLQTHALRQNRGVSTASFLSFPTSGIISLACRSSRRFGRESRPYSADLSMPRVGDDPVARRRRSDRRERPSSSVRPPIGIRIFSKMESATAASRRPQRVALSTALRAARPSCARVNG